MFMREKSVFDLPPEDTLIAHGNVRDLYYLGRERLLLVASDRISVFDQVLPTEIPDKGRVLTGISAFWFALTNGIVPNHFISLREDGRSMECQQLDMLPLQCVVRGHLAGSVQKNRNLSYQLADHMVHASVIDTGYLQKPVFIPSIKNEVTNRYDTIERAKSIDLLGGGSGGERLFDELEEVSLRLYEFAENYAASRGIMLADTRFEFGLDKDAKIVLANEALTPDSSHFWPVQSYRPGGPQPPSYDKQLIRDWAEEIGWGRTSSSPPPELPDDIVGLTRERFIEAFEHLTNRSFDEYIADPRIVF